MVSFTCDLCQDVIKKKNVDKHCETKCRNAWRFTCLTCNQTFEGFDYQNHNSCITEEQKYFGRFAKPKKVQGNGAVIHNCETNNVNNRETNKSIDGKANSEIIAHIKGDSKKSCNICKADLKQTNRDIVESSNKWMGGWTETVMNVLQNHPQKRMKWTDLANEVVDLYLAANTNRKEARKTLINKCLASIPISYTSSIDSFVSLRM